MIRVLASVSFALTLAVAVWAQESPPPLLPPQAPSGPTPMPIVLRNYTPVTEAQLRKPNDGDWRMNRRTYDGWGYSPLTAIDRSNVGALRMVWTRALGPGIQEGTPLVHDGVMYFPNPSDLVQALDAATGDLKWEYRRSLPADLGEYFPVPSINRNLAIYGNYILDNGADNYAYAIDARTGELAWETKILDYRLGGQASGGPMVANGKVISGRSCAPKGGPDGVAHYVVKSMAQLRRLLG